jgi:dipeptidase D
MGNIRTHEDKVVLSTLIRSNTDHFHDELIRKVKTIIELVGGEHILSAKAASWGYNPDSQLLVQSAAIYEELFGKKPILQLTHGQLETGALIQKIQECGREVEAIGIGPTSHGAHTTSEDLYIPSMQKMYDFICKMLEELK